MWRWFIPAVVLISSCSSPQPKARELLPYIRTFERVTGMSAWGVKVSFGELPPGVVGLCHYEDSERSIEISTKYWPKLSEYSREALLLHELGHCVLNLEHSDKLRSDNCPKSLMFPSLLPDECYLKHRPDYIRELSRHF